MELTIDGKNYTWRGEYRTPKCGEVFLDGSGGIYKARLENNPIRAIIYPVLVTHVFGGIKFEETGEEREGLREGQCGILIGSGNVVIAVHKIPPDSTYRILTPTGLV